MSSKSKIDISIVIGALNEENRLPHTLRVLDRYLITNKFATNKVFEVIIVCAKGSDDTASVARQFKKNIQNLYVLEPGEPLGKGRDIKYGVQASRGEFVIYMDADLATPLHHVERAYQEYNCNGYEVVIGTRELGSHHSSRRRLILSNLGNTMFRLVSGFWVSDTQCGFKGFSRKAAQGCFDKLRIMRWGFDMELLTIANTKGYAIKQIAIDDWKDVPDGTFASYGVLKGAIRTLMDLLLIFKRRLFREYN